MSHSIKIKFIDLKIPKNENNIQSYNEKNSIYPFCAYRI